MQDISIENETKEDEMTRNQAVQHIRDNYFPLFKMGDGYALVRLRHKAVLLPEYGIDGSSRDESEWALLDMFTKVDTGMYGEVYYF